MHEKARLTGSERDYEEALKLYQQYARKQRNPGAVWNDIGVCLIMLRRYPEALEAYKREEQGIESANNKYQIGFVLQAMNRSTEAIPYFQRAVALQPSYPIYTGALGKAFYDAGRFEEAIAPLEMHIRDRGQDLKTYFRADLELILMECYAATGRYREAAVLLAKRRWIGATLKSQSQGFLVEHVAKGMPADQAGIREGDVLIRWRGMPLQGLWDDRFQSIVEAAPLGDHLPVEFVRGTRTEKVDLLMGFRPEFMASSVPVRSTLKIQRLNVRPAIIPAGTPFEVEVEYLVTDGSAQTVGVTAEFSFRILEGQSVLFTQPPVRQEVPNGSVRLRTEKLTASQRGGKYTFQAVVRCGGAVAEGSVDFDIR